MKSIIFLTFILGILTFNVKSQELLDLFDEPEKETRDFVTATFKTTRIVNGQSVENVAHNELLFVVSHHFGAINKGPYEFFGLDQGTIRLGFDYGVFPWLTVGVGRSAFEKTFDSNIKLKILRQSTGKLIIPVTVSLYSTTTLTSLKWQVPERKNYFSSRMAFVNELLIARKISNSLSLQLTPAFIHKNLVKKVDEPNDIYALGLGGRLKITQRTTFNAEYFYVLPGQLDNSKTNSLSIGFDIETGGHVFQVYATNSMGMFDRNFITENTGKWSKGDIFLGFNITRMFTLKNK